MKDKLMWVCMHLVVGLGGYNSTCIFPVNYHSSFSPSYILFLLWNFSILCYLCFWPTGHAAGYIKWDINRMKEEWFQYFRMNLGEKVSLGKNLASLIVNIRYKWTGPRLQVHWAQISCKSWLQSCGSLIQAVTFYDPFCQQEFHHL